MTEQKQMSVAVEYVWLDAWGQIRSKTRILKGSTTQNVPDWTFDGGSTGQARSGQSDVTLKPVRLYPCSLRYLNAIAVCEIEYPNGDPHPTNWRHDLAMQYEKVKALQPQFGVEQEYTLLRRGSKNIIGREKETDAGIPKHDSVDDVFPITGKDDEKAVGNAYCRPENPGLRFASDHMLDCMNAGIEYGGLNDRDWETHHLLNRV